MPKKKPYREGDWFLVPLFKLPGRFGLGLVSRVGKGGILGGFFFGPASEGDPGETVRGLLRPADAALVMIFGDLGMVQDGWSVLGRLPTWEAEREIWRLPEFAHVDDLDRNVAFGRTYDPEDPSSHFIERRITPEEAQWMPRDGLAGHVFLQQRLTRLLTEDLRLPGPD